MTRSALAAEAAAASGVAAGAGKTRALSVALALAANSAERAGPTFVPVPSTASGPNSSSSPAADPTWDPRRWLPTSRDEIEARGWDYVDVIIVSGDA